MTPGPSRVEVPVRFDGDIETLEPARPGFVVGELVQIRGARVKIPAAQVEALMWRGADPSDAESEFLRIPWDAVGIAVGWDDDGPNGEPLLRVLFPQGLAAWWPDHFEPVRGR